MSSGDSVQRKAKLLKYTAVGLVALSLVLAVAGYRMSKQPAPSVTAEKRTELPYQVVVAARDIAPESTIGPGDVELMPYPVQPTASYSSLDKVLERNNFRHINRGEPLREDHFYLGSLLAAQVSSGYRAMAVSVDETVGTGGYLQPGDRVDIIYSTRANRETDNRSVARRVLQNVKILAYGSDIPGYEPSQDNRDTSGKRSRTAVLEVKDSEVSKLLLAENTGVLRLVAIGETDGIGDVAEQKSEDKLSTMNDLTGSRAPVRPQPRVYVYHGDSVQTVRTVQ